MTPTMEGASSDFLVLCLYAALSLTVFWTLADYVLQIRPLLVCCCTTRTICRFMAEFRCDTKWMNCQTNDRLEQSFAFYSKLAHTCACAAFMAPPWIWCKDHFVWCRSITNLQLDLIYCHLQCENLAMYLLGCSKYLTELSQLCNASLVLDLLAEANGPLDLHGLYCASFFRCASNL